MAKDYKITYKVYHNERLKKVFFHGRMTYPLYVQVTYMRKSIFFKSYYFDLLSSPKYMLQAAGLVGGPKLEDVFKLENELLAFIMTKHKDDFSFDEFRQWYDFYGADLCSLTEEGFVHYLHTFFEDKGRPSFADAIREGCRVRVPHDVVRDMKALLLPEVYRELIGNALFYAPPYLPLYGFMRQVKRWPLLLLSVREWLDEATRQDFDDYIGKRYDAETTDTIRELLSRYLKSLERKTIVSGST
ncbi:MAG: hypothetical protein KL787_07870 [Taibaiella sp.]|nr:hypothetical protein [Taibaiella sp.]MBX9449617.1 hypothetical protein [Taibaiella sp.]